MHSMAVRGILENAFVRGDIRPNFRTYHYGQDERGGPGRGHYHEPIGHRPHEHYRRNPVGLCWWCISDCY